MIESADIFAMRNPALCAVVVGAFAEGYHRGADDWPTMPLMFLPVPIVLSRRVTKTFKGTNRRTGLLEWLTRSPHVPTIVGQRLELTADVTRRGLLFSLRYGLLELDENARFVVQRRWLRWMRRHGCPPALRTYRREALRVGTWVGEVRHPPTVFHSFGVMP
jgi:hypothetical protein